MSELIDMLMSASRGGNDEIGEFVEDINNAIATGSKLAVVVNDKTLQVHSVENVNNDEHLFKVTFADDEGLAVRHTFFYKPKDVNCDHSLSDYPDAGVDRVKKMPDELKDLFDGVYEQLSQSSKNEDVADKYNKLKQRLDDCISAEPGKFYIDRDADVVYVFNVSEYVGFQTCDLVYLRGGVPKVMTGVPVTMLVKEYIPK